jgi:transcriptional regulator with XRE-family HTH domain
MNAAQCRMARAALKLGVRELAERAKVSPATIVRFEASGEGVLERTVDAIRSALESAGVEFTNGEQPGVRLRKGDGLIRATWDPPPTRPRK